MNNQSLLNVKKHIFRQWQFYLIILLPVVYIFIFCYIPMYGVLLAFKKYNSNLGIIGSPWIGFDNFKMFFTAPSMLKVVWNTLIINIYGILAGFPIPIILAIALNESKRRLSKTVQMITYAPYFISTVVLVGLIMQFLDYNTGFVNKIIEILGMEPVNFMGKESMFRHIYVWSGIWQSAGYSAVIYLAALAGISIELQEAAIIDGATRIQRIWNVDLPSIRPTIAILLLFSVGGLMNVGFEKIFFMQNNLNISVSEVVSTYVYKSGLITGNFSFSTAIGLFNSVISLVLLTTVNAIAKRLGESGIW